MGPGLSHKNGPNADWLLTWESVVSGIRQAKGISQEAEVLKRKIRTLVSESILFPHGSKIAEAMSLILDAQRKRRERGYLPELTLFIKQSQKNRRTIQITTSKHYHRLSFKTDSTLVIFSTSRKT